MDSQGSHIQIKCFKFINGKGIVSALRIASDFVLLRPYERYAFVCIGSYFYDYC